MRCRSTRREREGLIVKQMTLAAAKGFEVHGRATRKAEFLARMEALVPWAAFCALIEPHYPKNRPLTDADKETNRRKSSVRSKIEHPFLTLKRIWGFAKVRCRGLAKNANRAFAMLALINLSKWGRPLVGEVRPA